MPREVACKMSAGLRHLTAGLGPEGPLPKGPTCVAASQSGWARPRRHVDLPTGSSLGEAPEREAEAGRPVGPHFAASCQLHGPALLRVSGTTARWQYLRTRTLGTTLEAGCPHGVTWTWFHFALQDFTVGKQTRSTHLHRASSGGTHPPTFPEVAPVHLGVTVETWAVLSAVVGTF